MRVVHKGNSSRRGTWDMAIYIIRVPGRGIRARVCSCKVSVGGCTWTWTSDICTDGEQTTRGLDEAMLL